MLYFLPPLVATEFSIMIDPRMYGSSQSGAVTNNATISWSSLVSTSLPSKTRGLQCFRCATADGCNCWGGRCMYQGDHGAGLPGVPYVLVLSWLESWFLCYISSWIDGAVYSNSTSPGHFPVCVACRQYVLLHSCRLN